MLSYLMRYKNIVDTSLYNTVADHDTIFHSLAICNETFYVLL